ncbi:IS5/IS1182 family transposase, partial [Enterococcus avium]|nr:IS5/IS1182 family transposase [Enterococcus avium]
FAAMNLKKLATWLWKGKEPLFFCSKIRNEVDKKLFQARVTSLEQLLSTVCVIVFTITVMAVVLASLWLSGMF